MNGCPRCRAAAGDCRREHEGREGGQVVWTVWHCTRCRFTWRDSEPAASSDWNARPAWSRVDPTHPEHYRYNIPPAREG